MFLESRKLVEHAVQGRCNGMHVHAQTLSRIFDLSPRVLDGFSQGSFTKTPLE